MLEYFRNLIQIILNPQAGWEDLDVDQLKAWKLYKETHNIESTNAQPTAERPGADATDVLPDDYNEPSTATANISVTATLPETNFGNWIDKRMTRQMLTVVIPFFAVCSLTAFLRLFYGETVFEATQRAIVEFASLLMSLLVTRYAFLYFLPHFIHPEAEATRGRSLTVSIMVVSVLAVVVLLSNVVKVENTLLTFARFYTIFIVWKAAKYLDVLPWKTLWYVAIGSLFVLLTYFSCTALLNSVF